MLADPRSGCRFPGTIAAADAIVRTGPPPPETVLLLGSPWLSKALGEYVSGAAEQGARVVVLDPWHQWTDPTRVATEFHHCDADEWLATATESAEATDPAWLAVVEGHEKTLRRPRSTKTLATELSEPQVARQLYAHASDEWCHDRRLGLHAHT